MQKFIPIRVQSLGYCGRDKIVIVSFMNQYEKEARIGFYSRPTDSKQNSDSGNRKGSCKQLSLEERLNQAGLIPKVPPAENTPWSPFIGILPVEPRGFQHNYLCPYAEDFLYINTMAPLIEYHCGCLSQLTPWGVNACLEDTLDEPYKKRTQECLKDWTEPCRRRWLARNHPVHPYVSPFSSQYYAVSMNTGLVKNR